jgi:hypothetical protein
VATLTGLVTFAAALECLAGTALLLVPGVSILLLFGMQPDPMATLLGRIAGVALLSLGVACWGARVDVGGPARTSTVKGITLYNGGAGLLLLAAAGSGRATGIVIWIAAILHLGLAVAFADKTTWQRTARVRP